MKKLKINFKKNMIKFSLGIFLLQSIAASDIKKKGCCDFFKSLLKKSKKEPSEENTMHIVINKNINIVSIESPLMGNFNESKISENKEILITKSGNKEEVNSPCRLMHHERYCGQNYFVDDPFQRGYLFAHVFDARWKDTRK